MTEAEKRPDMQDSVSSSSSCEAPALTIHQMLATVVLNVLGLALPAAILQVYDRVIPNQTTETLTALMVGLIAVLVIDGALRISRGYLTSWSGAQFEHRCLARSRLRSSGRTSTASTRSTACATSMAVRGVCC